MRYKPYKPPYTIVEVVRMRSEGLTHSEIAGNFGISASRVGQLLKREREERSAAERSAVILNEIRSQDDPNRKLAIPDLFCVLDLSRRAEAVLKRHFSTNGITGFSLRDMMDFLLPVVNGPGEYIDYLPGLRVRTLGAILYREMIKRLSAVDAGESFQREWAMRKAQLRGAFSRNNGICYLTKRWTDALG